MIKQIEGWANTFLLLNPLYLAGLAIHKCHKDETTLKVAVAAFGIFIGITATCYRYYQGCTLLAAGLSGFGFFIFAPPVLAASLAIHEVIMKEFFKKPSPA